jgi:putative ABC transport system ATP-binding protein
MHLIGCLDTPTSGSLRIDGREIETLSANELADLRLEKIGFVFQNFQLLGGQTALENVELPLTYANIPRKQRRERAEEALTRVGLHDRMDFLPNQLSGGQKQRVAIARALVNHPSIVLADEPTGALDSKSGAQVMDLFEELNREGVTVLIITHDNGIASRARNKVEIRDGELGHLEENGK